MNDEKSDLLRKKLENYLNLIDLEEQEGAREAAEAESYRIQARVIRSLSGDFATIFKIDIATNRYRVYKFGSVTTQSEWKLQQEEQEDFFAACREYVRRGVFREDQERVLAALDKFLILAALIEKKTYHVNYRAVVKGQVRYYEAKFAFMVDDFGHRTALVMGLHDVDERTRYELGLIAKLNDALRQAESATELKNRFMFNMSHDVRAPMNAIMGFADMAGKNVENSEKVQECLAKIKKSGKVLLDLVDNISEVARIGEGKVRIEEQPCDLLKFLGTIKKIAELEVAAHGLRFELKCKDVDSFYVFMDAFRMNRILLSTIGNAVKYSRLGGVIRLEVRQTEGDGERAEYDFIVRDNGIGMGQEAISHIFEIFNTDGTADISGFEGTGIGMAVNRSLIDLMGGTINVESEIGEGTTVTIHLAFNLQSDEGQEAEEPEAFEEEVPVELKGKRILMVDDNELNREIARDILLSKGLLVEEASNGCEAVEKVVSNSAGYYNVILMDIQMPEMNGYQATETIRALPDKEKAAIPIVALTVNAFDEDIKKALEKGMKAHLTKPISVNNLFATIKKFV